MIIIIINCALGQSSKLKIKNMHMYGWKKKKREVLPESNLSVGQGFSNGIAHL